MRKGLKESAEERLSEPPFLLFPAGKDYLWGGERLKTEFHKNLPLTPLAETWECSTHPDGLSIVANGRFQGKTLSLVLAEHPEFLGDKHSHTKKAGELPILIKLIDAAKDLSVQVHPDDAYAEKFENGQLGKTELWYVLDASEQAKLVYGFQRDVSKQELQKSLEDGTVEELLNKVPIKRGDSFLIEAGTVHAIGAGALIAEIQENSNLTYRLFDYNRVGKDGKKRELHVEQSLAVANLKKTVNAASDSEKKDSGISNEKNEKDQYDGTKKIIAGCKYFTVENIIVSKEQDMSVLFTGLDTFEVLLCVEGEGTLLATDKKDEYLPLHKGDCIFVPAGERKLCLSGSLNVLRIFC